MSFFFSETNADLKETYCSACNSSWLQIQLGDDCAVLSHFGCARLVVTPWTVAHQAPLSMGFSKQEYWSGLPFPSAGDLPDPGIEPRFPALQADTLPVNHLRPNYGRGDEDIGDILQKVPCVHCYTQCPQPCSRPPLTHASTRDSWSFTGKSGSVSCGVTAHFSWVLVCTRFCLCAPICSPVLCKFWWLYGVVNGDLLQEGLC